MSRRDLFALFICSVVAWTLGNGALPLFFPFRPSVLLSGQRGWLSWFLKGHWARDCTAQRHELDWRHHWPRRNGLCS